MAEGTDQCSIDVTNQEQDQSDDEDDLLATSVDRCSIGVNTHTTDTCVEADDVIFPSDNLLGLPVEVTDVILSYLSETDLCRLAQCSRGWRETTNRDWLWRPLCVARGWKRYGTTVDLNPNEGVLDHMYSNVLIGENAKTLEATCAWKAVFLKAEELETNWAEGRYHDVPSFGLEVGFFGGGCVCDGEYVVNVSNSYIWIMKLKPEVEELFSLSMPQDTKFYITKMFLSKGICLIIGKYRRGHGGFYTNTFECRTGKWLVNFVCDACPVASSYRLDGETMIGQPCEEDDLREFCVWSSVDGILRHILRGHETNINDLALCGDMAASAAEDLKLWDVIKGECLGSFPGPQSGLGFSECKLKDNRLLGAYTYDEKYKLSVWDLESKRHQTITACDAHEVSQKLRIELNEFRVVLIHRRWSKVWNDGGRCVFNDVGEVHLAGTRILRFVQSRPSGIEVWSLGSDSRHWRRLISTTFGDPDDIFGIWADDTKLVIIRGSVEENYYTNILWNDRDIVLRFDMGDVFFRVHQFW